MWSFRCDTLDNHVQYHLNKSQFFFHNSLSENHGNCAEYLTCAHTNFILDFICSYTKWALCCLLRWDAILTRLHSITSQNTVTFVVAAVRILESCLFIVTEGLCCNSGRQSLVSLKKPGFNPRAVCVRFVVSKVTLGQVFLWVLWFSPASYSTGAPFSHLSSWAGTVYPSAS